MMKRLKSVLVGAFDAMIRSYEGKKFLPSLILKLIMAFASAAITVLFANTLFSTNVVANQVFAAFFFYFLMVSVGKLVAEIRRGGFGRRLMATLGNMVKLKMPALWFFLAAVIVGLFLPYAFVLALGFLLFCSALSDENSLLLGIKNAFTKGKKPEKNGKGIAGFASGLIVCGLVVCVLTNFGVPTIYGMIDGGKTQNGAAQPDTAEKGGNAESDMPSGTDDSGGNTTGDMTGGMTEDVWNNTEDNGWNDTGDTIEEITVQPDAGEAVSGETEIKEAARQLSDKLIQYAGNDREAFEKLFRGTDESVIDQYYNTSFEQFKEYDHCLIAIAAGDESYVWFTALYYHIPDGYPEEKEQSVFLSTIMSLSDGEWKIEWTDEARSRLQESYSYASFTDYGMAAADAGRPWAKFFIPFQPYNEELCYDDALLCKVIEMYVNEYGDVEMSLYVTNGTAGNIVLNRVDNITMVDGERELFSASFDLDCTIEPDGIYLFTLTIPADSVDFDTWVSPKITDFRFSYEAQ